MKLRGLGNLLYLYEKLKPDISILIKLHDVAEMHSLTKKDIINIVDYADECNYIEDEIEEKNWQLKCFLRQENDARASLLCLKKQLMDLSHQIDNCSNICIRKESYIENLNDDVEKIQNQISQLKNDEYYTKFEEFAREKLDLIINDHRWILRIAAGAVVESIRKDPNKQIIIKNDEVSKQEYESYLLDLSEDMFEKILNDLIDAILELS